jgi:hypothetical protein
MRTQARQISFRQGTESLEEIRGNHAIEDAVAEELQPFVVRRAVAAMSKRLGEQPLLGKTVPDAFLKALPIHVRTEPGRA